MRVEGKLDIDALQAAISEIVSRHEVLRTSFVTVDGQPRQLIARAATLTLPLIDLTHIPESSRESEAQRKANWYVQRPFELDKAPLLRAALLRLSEEEHVLALTMHHIISDGWSMQILLRELSLLYEAFSEGRPSPLEPLAIQYADYALWQREWMRGEVLNQQLGYWKRKLEGAPPVLELPTDRPRPAVQSFRGGRERLRLSVELTEGLKRMSKQEGATLFMSLLGGFNVLLSRYSGQGDIVVGTPVANRGRVEVEGVVGLFVNTVVMRTELSGEASYREVMRRVKEVAVEAYGRQGVPFERVVEEIRPERNLSHNPLFQVWFVLQNASTEQLSMGGLKLTSIRLNRVQTRHDLQLSLWETPDGLRGSFEYSADLFNPATIAGMARNFELLMEYAVAHPDAPLSALQGMLDDADKRQQVIREKQVEESALRRFKNTRRKAIIGS
jgi:hypothetical protein